MTKVVVAKAGSYAEQVVELAMKELLGELGDISTFIKPNERVLIKPNMLEGVEKDLSVTTHPEVVRAVIREVKRVGGIPYVGDSPGVSSTLKVAAKCGILQVCQEEGAKIIPFDHTMEVAFPAGRTVKKFTVATALEQADKVISLAKMKTHSFMGITGAVKNQFGFIVGTDKAQFHLRMKKRQDFAGMLVDLVRMVKPVLFVVDGIVGMEGRGPRNGSPRPAGVLIAGTNGFAVDLIMADIMGFTGDNPVAISAAAAGLLPKREEIEVIGSGRDVKLNFQAANNLESIDGRIPSWLVQFGQNQLTAKPDIACRCIGCGRCAQHCPPQAIKIENKKAVIDYEKCIRCYCCQELCPEDAVHLKSGLLLKWIKRWL